MRNFNTNQISHFFVALTAIILFSRCEGEFDQDFWGNISGDSTQVNIDINLGDSTSTSSDSTATDSTGVGNSDSTDISGDTNNPTACADCDHVVNSYITDGDELGIQPGDIIGIAAGQDYDRIVFRNIHGTKENPVIIRNCGGVASITSNDAFGMKFEYSDNFILSGDGSGDQYGLKISTSNGFFLTLEKFTTDFEIKQVEIAGPVPNGQGSSTTAGFAGIGVKTSPYQDCELFSDPTRTAWIMRNVSIHDNYIHDTGGEGLYVGHGMYEGRIESRCTQMTYSHSIKGLRIYNNLIENVGYDGMQIKNADEDVKVYNNIVRNYGTRNHNSHNEGLFIGDGSTGEYFNNAFIGGTGNGCQLQGLGNIDIYNNLFIDQQQHGFYAAQGPRFEDGYFNIFNNTIIGWGTDGSSFDRYGYVFYNSDGGEKRFINNIVAGPGVTHKNDATTELSNNLFTNDIESVGFESPALNNYRLKAGSMAIDAGMDLTSYGIDDDHDGSSRPNGRSFDIGAFEH